MERRTVLEIHDDGDGEGVLAETFHDLRVMRCTDGRGGSKSVSRLGDQLATRESQPANSR